MAYYVVSDDKCFFEGMTKEQILAAITQAVETHEISDVDTGFVTTLKESNANRALTFWVGTTAEYNAIPVKTDNCFYILTDDTEIDDIESEIADLQTQINNLGGLRGTVLLNTQVDYYSDDDIGELEYPLATVVDFSKIAIVKVTVNGYGEVLCNFNLDDDIVYIRGTSCGVNSDEDQVNLIAINIKLDAVTNMLILNRSTVVDISSDQIAGITGQTITKIAVVE